MSVEAKDLIFYGSANMPEADTGTAGGAVDKTKKIVFADIITTDTVSVVSSSASDTANITLTITGRDASGALVSEAENTNGKTKVPTALEFYRILKVVGSGTGFAARVGDVAAISDTPTRSSAVQTGCTNIAIKLDAGASGTNDAYKNQILRMTSGTYSGEFGEIVKYNGTTKIANLRKALTGAPTAADTYEVCPGCVLEKALGTAAVDVVEVRRPFYNAASDEEADKDYYEKIFLFNLNTTTTLASCTVAEVAVGVYANVHFALCSAFGGSDSGTSTDRITVPASGIGAWKNDTDGNIDIANSKNLTYNDAQGLWLHLDLAAGDAGANDIWRMQVNGQTI